MLTNPGFKMYPDNHQIDLNLIQVGYEKCEPTHVFGPAIRNFYLFHYIMSGKGTLYADDHTGVTQVYQVEADSAFMIFPDQVTTYLANETDPWEYVWVGFDGILAKDSIRLAGMSIDHPVCSFPLPEVREKVLREMLYLVQHRDSSVLHLTGHLYLFLDFLTRSPLPKQASGRSGKNARYMKDAVSFMESHLQTALSIEDISSHCGLTRSYFGKLFKEEFGKTPQEFLTRMRMEKAADLLLQTNRSIGEISSQVGYPDQLHFSKVFRSVYGLSPRQWRSQKRGQDT